MKNIIILFLILISFASCQNKRQTSFDEKVVKKIIDQDHIIDSNYIVLNIKEGQFHLFTKNDTSYCYFNGLEFFRRVGNLTDNTIFNMDSDSLSFFSFQGFWNSDYLATKDIKLEDIVLQDTIPNIPIDSLFIFNWKRIPSKVKGFIIFSKPEVDNNGNGVIGQMTFTRKNMLFMKVFSINNSGEDTIIKKVGCVGFKLIAFQVELDNEIIKRIKPLAITFMGPC